VFWLTMLFASFSLFSPAQSDVDGGLGDHRHLGICCPVPHPGAERAFSD
jgi:hypothetical protein